jgi:hypothetical protein
LEFRRHLKQKIVGLAVIHKARARQHSRLTWIRKGGTNSRFFQLHGNARRNKHFIRTLKTPNDTVNTKKEKKNIYTD